MASIYRSPLTSGPASATLDADRGPACPGTIGPMTEPGTIKYEPHVGETRQYWRDMILGINDGLVSIFLLVAGVVGGGLGVNQVLLTAIAGAVGGAISMAAGEYLATRSQEEVFDSEIALERTHIKYFREDEVGQLRDYFADIGVRHDDLPGVVEAFSHDDETILNAMKVLEFGIVDSERRSPYLAMAASGLFFIVGSLTSVAPFIGASSPRIGLVIAALLTALGLFAVGVAKTRVTKTDPVRSGLQNLVIAGVGGLLAFGIGLLVDQTFFS